MSTDEFRTRAAACLESARQSAHEGAKGLWLSMAQRWLERAQAQISAAQANKTHAAAGTPHGAPV